MGVHAPVDSGGGPERFHTLARLGAGANGAVYRALDLVLGSEVAVKVLTREGGREVFRFKREFRALSEVLHPNLVRLYELFVADDQWSFSMELIDGVPLDQYLRARRGDDDALRRCFIQLADAVLAIHALGKVHRDLKPSNVLVTPEGRVVVLDFGLIGDTETLHVDRTHEAAAVGTPAYMSPEQASDKPLTSATDWYSVGAMLYMVLTGRRPFEGTASEVLRRRVLEDPKPPSALVPEISPAMDALCMALLHRDPARRAGGHDVLRALGGAPSAATQTIAQLATAHRFVGRRRELAQLEEALSLAHAGHGVMVTVTGPSGIGKSTLLRHFLDELDPASTVVFEGRCYERETMPFQAIDSLVDAVATHLMALPAHQVEPIVPRDITALARLFPTLNRVPAIGAPRLRASLPPDQAELRRRAVTAFADLLAAIAGQRTLVVFLDDLHWSDPDSGLILADLLHHFDDVGALFLAASRSREDGDLTDAIAAERGTPTVRIGSTTSPASRSSLLVRELAVGPMERTDAAELAVAVGGDPRGVAAIVEEAGGVPLFLAELARRGAGPDGAAPTLERLLAERIAALPPDARVLLEVCAISARPVRLDTAALLLGGDAAAALTVLRTERLVRVDREGAVQRLEPSHASVRAAVHAALDEDAARALHARLAAALEGRPGTLETDLVGHWLAAGELQRAAVHARGAAAQAEATMAFHRAADLYQLALAGPALSPVERRELLCRMSDCLANVGRLDAALGALGEAQRLGVEITSSTGEVSSRQELERLEVEYALRVGDYGRGLEAARALLARLGYQIPVGVKATIARVLWAQLRQRVRGLELRPAPAGGVPAAVAQRIDTLWSLTAGLAYVNPAIGRLVQLYHLRAALDGGDEARALRALSLEIPTLAQSGESARARVDATVARWQQLAAAHDEPELHGLLAAAHAVAEAIMGRFDEALALARSAEQQLRDHCTGIRWALAMAQFYRVMACWFRGDLREVVRLVPRYVTEAEELGDAHTLGGMRTGRGSVYWLIVDRPVDGRAMAAAGLPRRNPDDAFHLHDYFHALADAQLDLYEGAPGHAVERVEGSWAAFEGSLLVRVQFVRLDALLLRARCAVAQAAATTGAARDAALARARKTCARVDREDASWVRGLTALIRAGIAQVEGDRSAAIAQLEAAVRFTDEHHLGLHGQAARHRLGECLGGAEGAALTGPARAWFVDGGVVRPEALLRVLAPGW